MPDLAGLPYGSEDKAIEGAKRALGPDTEVGKDFIVEKHWATDTAWAWYPKDRRG